MKVALALRAWSSVSAQVVDVPAQAPPQPVNVCPPPAGVADSVTCVPYGNEREHAPLLAPTVMVQEIPAGVDLTVPFPVPTPDTERDCSGSGSVASWQEVADESIAR